MVELQGCLAMGTVHVFHAESNFVDQIGFRQMAVSVFRHGGRSFKGGGISTIMNMKVVEAE